MSHDPKITVGIPIYNEQEVLPELMSRLSDVLEGIPGGPHEVIVVDDGSTDASGDILKRMTLKNAGLVIIQFSRNFGHQPAMTAILEQASHDLVILMDGDLQDPPEVIPKLIHKYREGFDVVYAQRSSRQENWFLKTGYYLFYRVIRSLSTVELPVDSGDFALLSRKAVDAINSSHEYHRYLRGLRSWAGFPQAGISLDRPARPGGESKYGLGKLMALALDGIFSFSIIPLRLATFIGGACVLVCALFGVYALYVKLAHGQSPVGFTALILTIILAFGVQMIFLGVLGEYVGRIYNEAKGRPLYVVNRIIRTAGDRDEKDLRE